MNTSRNLINVGFDTHPIPTISTIIVSFVTLPIQRVFVNPLCMYYVV